MKTPMNIPLPTLSDSPNRADCWRKYRDQLYRTLQMIAQERLSFLVSVFLSTIILGLVVSAIGAALFGMPPTKNAPDSAAPWRALFSLLGNTYSAFLMIGLMRVIRLWLKGDTTTGWNAIAKTSFKHWMKILVTYLLFFAGCAIGFVLLIFPGVWFLLTYQFAMLAIADDPDLGIMEAFRISQSLTTGNRWEIIVTSLVTSVRFWWRHGGRWSLFAIIAPLIGYVILTALTVLSGGGSTALGILFNVINWLLAAVGIVGIVGLVLTAIYTSIILQYTYPFILFLGLSRRHAPEATEIGAAPEEAPLLID